MISILRFEPGRRAGGVLLKSACAMSIRSASGHSGKKGAFRIAGGDLLGLNRPTPTRGQFVALVVPMASPPPASFRRGGGSRPEQHFPVRAP